MNKHELYKWKWMVLGALGCINNADFEKIIKWQNCVRCVYCLSEFMTNISNLKNTLLVHAHRPSK